MAAACCTAHAKDGVMDVHRRRCAHATCSVSCLVSMSKAARRRYTARNMLTTAWSTFAAHVAHVTTARGCLHGVHSVRVRGLHALAIRRIYWRSGDQRSRKWQGCGLWKRGDSAGSSLPTAASNGLSRTVLSSLLEPTAITNDCPTSSDSGSPLFHVKTKG